MVATLSFSSAASPALLLYERQCIDGWLDCDDCTDEMIFPNRSHVCNRPRNSADASKPIPDDSTPSKETLLEPDKSEEHDHTNPKGDQFLLTEADRMKDEKPEEAEQNEDEEEIDGMADVILASYRNCLTRRSSETRSNRKKDKLGWRLTRSHSLSFLHLSPPKSSSASTTDERANHTSEEPPFALNLPQYGVEVDSTDHGSPFTDPSTITSGSPLVTSTSFSHTSTTLAFVNMFNDSIAEGEKKFKREVQTWDRAASDFLSRALTHLTPSSNEHHSLRLVRCCHQPNHTSLTPPTARLFESLTEDSILSVSIPTTLFFQQSLISAVNNQIVELPVSGELRIPYRPRAHLSVTLPAMVEQIVQNLPSSKIPLACSILNAMTLVLISHHTLPHSAAFDTQCCALFTIPFCIQVLHVCLVHFEARLTLRSSAKMPQLLQPLLTNIANMLSLALLVKPTVIPMLARLSTCPRTYTESSSAFDLASIIDDFVVGDGVLAVHRVVSVILFPQIAMHISHLKSEISDQLTFNQKHTGALAS
ncbi:hypothetical protein BLNAU_10805 [Blattamonas nauphoetae]|uniref:Uncharacterized protein n=1 Tax=Blattamonas nauphoetae TaxID=2049346 RepID=A0ABQ9XPF1_9EUKA|nr:hypothetical protein BLNAU_10805 [Blattamonas nauphoetae]